MEKCCQSCGLPFNEEHKHFIAKEVDCTESIYCTMCYKDGEFIVPNMTMDEMIEIQVPHLVGSLKLGTETEIRKQLREVLPKLQRWM